MWIKRLDGKHTVFGEVVEGMNIIKSMEAVGTRNGTPTKKVVIENCGEIKAEEQK